MVHKVGLGIALVLGSSAWGIDCLEAVAQTEPVWYDCRSQERFSPEKQAWCDNWQALQQASLIVPTSLEEEPVFITIPLADGQYEQSDGSLQVLLVNEQNWLTFGDIDGDGLDDAATIFGVVPDGETVETYLAVVLDVQGKAQALEPVRLGERILLNGPIAMAENQLRVPQLTQTMVINRDFYVEGNALAELAQFPLPMLVMDGTLLFSQTPDYAVRVFDQAGLTKLNLFDKSTGSTILTGVSVIPQSYPSGMTYSYTGTGLEPSLQVQVATDGDQTLLIQGGSVVGERLTGRVTYAPRIALPANAVVEVVLEDVSRADAPSIPLASQTLAVGDRQVPIPFELMYDPEQIAPTLTYALRVRITVDGELRFINTTRVPVITRDNPTTDVDVIVDPV
jgi:uncharacterized lipoprotein YbaY